MGNEALCCQAADDGLALCSSRSREVALSETAPQGEVYADDARTAPSSTLTAGPAFGRGRLITMSYAKSSPGEKLGLNVTNDRGSLVVRTIAPDGTIGRENYLVKALANSEDEVCFDGRWRSLQDNLQVLLGGRVHTTRGEWGVVTAQNPMGISIRSISSQAQFSAKYDKANEELRWCDGDVWRREAKDRLLRTGDRILAVNEVCGNERRMVAAASAAPRELRLEVFRPQEP